MSKHRHPSEKLYVAFVYWIENASPVFSDLRGNDSTCLR